MYRKITPMAIVAFVVTVCLAPCVVADEEGVARKAPTEVKAKEALLSSATLTEDPGMMKGLAKTLGADKGILSAKFDDEKKLLRVVFDPKKTSAEAMQKALGEHLPDLALNGVKDTKWNPKSCGGCPKAAKCKGKDKAEGEHAKHHE